MAVTFAIRDRFTEFTNYITNPRAASSPGGWSHDPAGGSTALTYMGLGGPTGVPTFARCTWSSNATAPGGALYTPTTYLPAGKYRVSAMVRTNSTATRSIGLLINGSFSGTFTPGPPTTGVANVWIGLTGTLVLNAPATVGLRVGWISGDLWANGVTLDATAVMIANSRTPLSYFDGNSDGAHWNGDTNNSSSTKWVTPPHEYEAASYSVTEDSSPLTILDSSGSVGTFSATLKVPENPSDPVRLYGEGWMLGKPVDIEDSRFGFVPGTIDSVSMSNSGDIVSVAGTTRLGSLNVFSIQAQPFSGTLGNAFVYYLSLGGITTEYEVDASIASRPVNYIGWNGELWYHLKMMASAQQCDIALIDGVITLRPSRSSEIVPDYTTQRSNSFGGGTLAQSVEAYYYQTNAITNGLAYPAGGWTPEVEVLNVNSGETTEYTIDLGASLASFQEPVMVTSVAPEYDASSVYTIIADDGLTVDPQAWADFGGSVTFALNPDTVSMTVTLVGAVDFPTDTGEFSKSFSVALASDISGNRYSTLRIVGTGVAYTSTKKTFRTGISAAQTTTEVGVTIDNPFVTTLEGAYTAGVQAAKSFTGLTPILSGTVIRVNTPDSDDPTFGNVAGARMYDYRTKRWFRVRSATISPSGVSYDSAEDDLLWSDILGVYAGMTYGDVQTLNSELTYQEVRLAGART